MSKQTDLTSIHPDSNGDPNHWKDLQSKVARREHASFELWLETELTKIEQRYASYTTLSSSKRALGRK